MSMMIMKRFGSKEGGEGVSSRGRGVAGLRGRGRWAALALVLGALSGAVEARDGAPRCDDAACLAEALIKEIPKDHRIALIPFGPPFGGIPGKAAADLYERIAHAMQDASARMKKGHNFTAKDRTKAMWQAHREEGYGAKDFNEAFRKQRRVQVLVQCEDGGWREGGMALACVATPVGEGSKLKGDVRGPQTVLRVAGRLFRYEYALESVAHELAAQAAKQQVGSGRITRETFIFQEETGERTRLTGDIGQRIRKAVGERSGGGGGRAATAGAYQLRGRMKWVTDETATLTVWLTDRGGAAGPEASGEIERSWLPKGLLERGEGVLRYGASAVAVASGDFHPESARRAAKNLARARVVAKALGVPAPEIEEVRSGEQGVRVLRRTLDRGIPVDERFEGPWRGQSGEWKVELQARVVAVSSAARPGFTASLANEAVRAGESIRIELAAEEAVHVGLFAWGADDRVVRLYPRDQVPPLKLRPGARVSLPRGGDGRIASAPLPGHRADHEAYIAVASGERLAFEKLAPSVGASLAEAMAAGVSGSGFFDALGELDLSRVAVVVLPYRVSR